MAGPDSFTLDWLRERVRLKHHKVLARYLKSRNPAQKAQADIEGYDTNTIIRKGFVARNGWTNVPEFAISVLKIVPGVDPRVVWEIVQSAVQETRDPNVINWLGFKKALEISRARDSHWADACDSVLNEVIVYDVMER